MRIDRALFRAYDIRGVYGAGLSTTSAYAIGRAIAAEAHARGCSVLTLGRDGRVSSEALAEAMSLGLLESGCEVIDVGVVPSPVLYFATEYLGTYSGVMVTASHNPAQYNGFKVILAGKTLSEVDYDQLYGRITRDEFVSGIGRMREDNVMPAYLRAVAKDIVLKRKLSVVVDGGNGSAGPMASDLLHRLGCRVSELYCNIDGRFPHHAPDPSDPDNLVDLIQRVRVEGADIGIALDGDGDRLGVIDNEGTIIWPDRQMIGFARDVLTRHPGAAVVYDIKCTSDLPKAIFAQGGRPVLSRTGHSIMRARMMEENAVLAGEFSGHMFFRDRWNGFDDGLYAAARLLELLSREQVTAATVFRRIPAPLSTAELRIPVAPREATLIMGELRTLLADGGEGTICCMDGIRVDYPYGWGLVRYSNTLPVLTLRFEAHTPEYFAQIKLRFKTALHAVSPGLTLPF